MTLPSTSTALSITRAVPAAAASFESDERDAPRLRLLDFFDCCTLLLLLLLLLALVVLRWFSCTTMSPFGPRSSDVDDEDVEEEDVAAAPVDADVDEDDEDDDEEDEEIDDGPGSFWDFDAKLPSDVAADADDD